uniref:DNA-directed RNA polymerase subunit beta'' n=1 Tax=Chlorogonium capillatum TaxID=71743 RepID=A0A0S2IC72_9CHLO|nr:beta'' subunit of RNA polymerase [Chlorogonium capillatum]
MNWKKSIYFNTSKKFSLAPFAHTYDRASLCRDSNLYFSLLPNRGFYLNSNFKTVLFYPAFPCSITKKRGIVYTSSHRENNTGGNVPSLTGQSSCQAGQSGQEMFKKFFNQCFDKGRLKNFVLWFLLNYGEHKTVTLVEQLKNVGFQYASKAGISLGIDDLKIPPKKAILIYDAEKQTSQTVHQYVRGEITGVERFQRLIDTWHRTSEVLKQEVIDYFEATDILNPVYMMAFSGARGNISQVRQLVGMRGLMADPQGQIIDFPIRSNFREGLTLTEYIISSYGARKGIVDTALRTANAGYLTRRLVDVAQHVIISNFDCGTRRGIFLINMKEGNKTIHSLSHRTVGRILARDLFYPTYIISNNEKNKDLTSLSSLRSLALTPNPEGVKGKREYRKEGKLKEGKNSLPSFFAREIYDGQEGRAERSIKGPFARQSLRADARGEFLARRNDEVTLDLAFEIGKKFDKVFVRSPLTCETNHLICQLCYGWSLAQGNLVSIGEAVGVIAAQSIGEPGTQLTMRTFHTGGVFSGDISDQIRAPFNGFVEYTSAIPGTLIRTPEGKIAFLTKSEGSFIVSNTLPLNRTLTRTQASPSGGLHASYAGMLKGGRFANHAEGVVKKAGKRLRDGGVRNAGRPSFLAHPSEDPSYSSPTEENGKKGNGYTEGTEVNGQSLEGLHFKKFNLNTKQSFMNKYKSKVSKRYKVPPFTLLYIRNGQPVSEKEVIAQISNISRKGNATDNAELTIKSDYEGQFYSKSLGFREKHIGPEIKRFSILPALNLSVDAKKEEIAREIYDGRKLHNLETFLDRQDTNYVYPHNFGKIYETTYFSEKIYEAWTWGYAWILSGKIYEANSPSRFFAQLGDYLNLQSCMSQTKWKIHLNQGNTQKIKFHISRPSGGQDFFQSSAYFSSPNTACYPTEGRATCLKLGGKARGSFKTREPLGFVNKQHSILNFDLKKILFKQYGYILFLTEKVQFLKMPLTYISSAKQPSNQISADKGIALNMSPVLPLLSCPNTHDLGKERTAINNLFFRNSFILTGNCNKREQEVSFWDSSMLKYMKKTNLETFTLPHFKTPSHSFLRREPPFYIRAQGERREKTGDLLFFMKNLKKEDLPVFGSLNLRHSYGEQRPRLEKESPFILQWFPQTHQTLTGGYIILENTFNFNLSSPSPVVSFPKRLPRTSSKQIYRKVKSWATPFQSFWRRKAKINNLKFHTPLWNSLSGSNGLGKQLNLNLGGKYKETKYISYSNALSKALTSHEQQANLPQGKASGYAISKLLEAKPPSKVLWVQSSFFKMDKSGYKENNQNKPFTLPSNPNPAKGRVTNPPFNPNPAFGGVTEAGKGKGKGKGLAKRPPALYKIRGGQISKSSCFIFMHIDKQIPLFMQTNRQGSYNYLNLYNKSSYIKYMNHSIYSVRTGNEVLSPSAGVVCSSTPISQSSSFGRAFERNGVTAGENNSKILLKLKVPVPFINHSSVTPNPLPASLPASVTPPKAGLGLGLKGGVTKAVLGLENKQSFGKPSFDFTFPLNFGKGLPSGALKKPKGKKSSCRMAWDEVSPKANSARTRKDIKNSKKRKFLCSLNNLNSFCKTFAFLNQMCKTFPSPSKSAGVDRVNAVSSLTFGKEQEYNLLSINNIDHATEQAYSKMVAELTTHNLFSSNFLKNEYEKYSLIKNKNKLNTFIQSELKKAFYFSELESCYSPQYTHFGDEKYFGRGRVRAGLEGGLEGTTASSGLGQAARKETASPLPSTGWGSNSSRIQNSTLLKNILSLNMQFSCFPSTSPSPSSSHIFQGKDSKVLLSETGEGLLNLANLTLHANKAGRYFAAEGSYTTVGGVSASYPPPYPYPSKAWVTKAGKEAGRFANPLPLPLPASVTPPKAGLGLKGGLVTLPLAGLGLEGRVKGKGLRQSSKRKKFFFNPVYLSNFSFGDCLSDGTAFTVPVSSSQREGHSYGEQDGEFKSNFYHSAVYANEAVPESMSKINGNGNGNGNGICDKILGNMKSGWIVVVLRPSPSFLAQTFGSLRKSKHLILNKYLSLHQTVIQPGNKSKENLGLSLPWPVFAEYIFVPEIFDFDKITSFKDLNKINLLSSPPEENEQKGTSAFIESKDAAVQRAAFGTMKDMAGQHPSKAGMLKATGGKSKNKFQDSTSLFCELNGKTSFVKPKTYTNSQHNYNNGNGYQTVLTRAGGILTALPVEKEPNLRVKNKKCRYQFTKHNIYGTSDISLSSPFGTVAKRGAYSLGLYLQPVHEYNQMSQTSLKQQTSETTSSIIHNEVKNIFVSRPLLEEHPMDGQEFDNSFCSALRANIEKAGSRTATLFSIFLCSDKYSLLKNKSAHSMGYPAFGLCPAEGRATAQKEAFTFPKRSLFQKQSLWKRTPKKYLSWVQASFWKGKQSLGPLSSHRFSDKPGTLVYAGLRKKYNKRYVVNQSFDSLYHWKNNRTPFFNKQQKTHHPFSKYPTDDFSIITNPFLNTLINKFKTFNSTLTFPYSNSQLPNSQPQPAIKEITERSDWTQRNLVSPNTYISNITVPKGQGEDKQSEDYILEGVGNNTGLMVKGIEKEAFSTICFVSRKPLNFSSFVIMPAFVTPPFNPPEAGKGLENPSKKYISHAANPAFGRVRSVPPEGKTQAKTHIEGLREGPSARTFGGENLQFNSALDFARTGQPSLKHQVYSLSYQPLSIFDSFLYPSLASSISVMLSFYLTKIMELSERYIHPNISYITNLKTSFLVPVCTQGEALGNNPNPKVNSTSSAGFAWGVQTLPFKQSLEGFSSGFSKDQLISPFLWNGEKNHLNSLFLNLFESPCFSFNIHERLNMSVLSSTAGKKSKSSIEGRPILNFHFSCEKNLLFSRDHTLPVHSETQTLAGLAEGRSLSRFLPCQRQGKQAAGTVMLPQAKLPPYRRDARVLSSRVPVAPSARGSQLTKFSYNYRKELLSYQTFAKTNHYSPFNGEIVYTRYNLDLNSQLMTYSKPSKLALNIIYPTEDSCMFLTKADLISYYLPSKNFIFTFNQVFNEAKKKTYTIQDTLIKFVNMASGTDEETTSFATSQVWGQVDESSPLPSYTSPSLREERSIFNIQGYETTQPASQGVASLPSRFAPGAQGKNGGSSLLTLPSAGLDRFALPSAGLDRFALPSAGQGLKISKLKAGIPLAYNLSLLGDFFVYGDPISPTTAIQSSGQIIHYNNQKITLRRAQPIFISPKGILRKFDGDFIDPKAPVITLSYQRLKTGDIIQGIPKVEQFFEARTTKRGRLFRDSLPSLLKGLFKRYLAKLPLDLAVRQSFYKIQQIVVDGVQRVYKSQGVTISDKHLEVIVKQMTNKVRILDGAQTGFFPGEVVDLCFVEKINSFLIKKITYEPLVLGITKASLEVDSFLSAASFQQTTRVLSKAAIYRKKDFLKGLKENVILGNLIPAGTGYLVYLDDLN